MKFRWRRRSTAKPSPKSATLGATANAKRMRRLHSAGCIPPYETLLSEFYSKLLSEGAVVIDVGAHHGLHLDKFAALAKAVVAFEPVPEFEQILRGKHGLGVDIRKKALADHPGRAKFLHMVEAAGESGFKARASAEDRGAHEIEVEVSTLDLELPDLTRLTFLKLDTEGSELSILRGGAKLIQRTRPFISIEYGAPSYSLYGLTADSLYDWATDADYRIADLFGSVVGSREEWHSVCDVSYWDYLLFPAEKRRRFAGTFRALNR